MIQSVSCAESQSFVVKDPGAEDKRLLVTEEEFASVFKQTKKKAICFRPCCAGVDGKALEVLNRRKNCLKATEAHVSAIGQITPDEYRHYILKSSESVNGFSNRFLHKVVRRQRLLPHGGNALVLDDFVRPLADALTRAKSIGEVKRSAEAATLWGKEYAGLSQSKPGAYGKAVSVPVPGDALALVYALLDGSVTVEAAHLRAALRSGTTAMPRPS